MMVRGPPRVPFGNSKPYSRLFFFGSGSLSMRMSTVRPPFQIPPPKHQGDPSSLMIFQVDKAGQVLLRRITKDHDFLMICAVLAAAFIREESLRPLVPITMTHRQDKNIRTCINSSSFILPVSCKIKPSFRINRPKRKSLHSSPRPLLASCIVRWLLELRPRLRPDPTCTS